VRDSFAASESVELAPNGVAGFDRNGWPASVGTGGRIASESVAGLARITHEDRGSLDWTYRIQTRHHLGR
jgi:hypothetical protein